LDPRRDRAPPGRRGRGRHPPQLPGPRQVATGTSSTSRTRRMKSSVVNGL
jgi:hypothetical protein